MKASILSIAAGNKKTYSKEDNTFLSSYKKDEFYNFIDINELGIIKDTQSDRIHHGGIDKAIHIGSSLHLKRLKGVDKLAFGYNIFINDYDEDDICIGDIYSVGDIILEVSQPRQPCWKIAAIFNKEVSRYIAKKYAVGWYVRVLNNGVIDINDDMVLKKRVSSISIKTLSQYLTNPPKDKKIQDEILNINVLAEAYKNSFIKACNKIKN